jgi:hypothetical protein
MTLDEIENSLKLVETEYNNLNDHNWLAHRLSYLRGRFDFLKELKEKETNATTTEEPSAVGQDSNND